MDPDKKEIIIHTAQSQMSLLQLSTQISINSVLLSSKGYCNTNLNRSILKTTRQSLTRALILVCRISQFNRTALMKRHKLNKMQTEDIRHNKSNSRISLGFRPKVSFRCSLNRKRICQSRKTMQLEAQ